MGYDSYTAQVLGTLGELAKQHGEVTVEQLSHTLHIQTTIEHKAMLNVLSELYRSGRVLRLRQGVYALAAAREQDTMELRRVMWRILRMRKRVTLEDMQTMAGASEDYAREWLTMLEGQGVVAKISASRPSIWKLISTDVEMPHDAKKAEALRARRARAKETLAHLRSARTMINKAIAAMEQEGEG